jgi:hypothetical protein
VGARAHAAPAPAFDAAALPRVAWALAALGAGPPRPTLERLAARCADEIAGLDGDAVAGLVWALDRLDSVPGKPLVSTVTGAARRALLRGRNGGGGGAAAPQLRLTTPSPATQAAPDVPARGGAGGGKGSLIGRMLLARPARRQPTSSRR